MFISNILRFMSNFSFKGDTLYRSIPSRGIDLFIPPDSLMGGYNITGHQPFHPLLWFPHPSLHSPPSLCVRRFPPDCVRLGLPSSPPITLKQTEGRPRK